MPVYSNIAGNAWMTPVISGVVGVSWRTPVISGVVGVSWRTPVISGVVGVSWNTYDDVTVLLSNPTATVNANTGEAILEVDSNIASGGTLYVAWYAGTQTAKTPAEIIAGTGSIDFTNAPADYSNQFTVPFESWDADYFAAFVQKIP